MTNTMQNPISCKSGDHRDFFLHSFKLEAELEKLDREEGHDYVPMDIFVDPGMMKEHFQYSAIRARWAAVCRAGASQTR